jgi:hypothetical protein
MTRLFHGDPVPLNNRPASFDLMAWLKGPPGHLPDRVGKAYAGHATYPKAISDSTDPLAAHFGLHFR